jgi:hypothetical protein
MGATPQPPRNTPDGLIKWMKWVEGRISFILEKLNNVLANTGLSVPSPGVTQVDGTFDVLGTENVSGNLNVTGDLTVSGTLVLPNGSVNDAWLTNPIRGDSAFSSASNFALTTTGTTPLVSQSWYTPTGFTTADVLIVGRVFAYNSTASLDYLFARSRVYVPSSGQTGYGIGLPLAVSASGGSGLNSSPISVKVENLTDGQEIRLEIQGWTNTAGWAANAGNVADVAGQIIWTR